MDGSRFDRLSRQIAASGSRRGLLKSALGVVLGGAAVAPALSGADARTRSENGVACASPRDCASGFCVDGVCCDSPCLGTCGACNVAGLEGTCSPVAGAPVGNRGPCPGDGGVCNGVCDGVTIDYCAGFPAGETSCGGSTCADGWQVSNVCSGNGVCITTTTSCEFGCAGDGITCLGECQTGTIEHCRTCGDACGEGLLCDPNLGCVECLSTEDCGFQGVCTTGASCEQGVCHYSGEGGSCGTFEFGCGGFECASGYNSCAMTSEGNVACIGSLETCPNLPSCQSSSDCGPDAACTVGTCCEQGPVCIPYCGTESAELAPASRRSDGTETRPFGN